MALEVVSWCCFHLSFQVRNAALVTEEERIDVAKKIIIRARLCATGCGSVHDLGNIKMMILCAKADGNCIHLLLFSSHQSSIQLYYHFLPHPVTFCIFFLKKVMNMLFQVSGGMSLLRSLQLLTLMKTVSKGSGFWMH